MVENTTALALSARAAKLCDVPEQVHCTDSDFFDPARQPRLRKYAFQDDVFGIVEGGGFGKNCFIYLSEVLEGKLRNKDVRLRVQRMGPAREADNVELFVDDFSGVINVLVGSWGSVILGRLGQVNMDIRIGHGGMLVVGDETTVNGARFVAVNGTIALKRDVMLSDEILVQGSDQHGIIDMQTGGFINLDRNFVVVEPHVWIGRRATIMPGVRLGAGAIIGACSVVTTDAPSLSVVAGVPARIVRENVSWVRPWNQIDDGSRRFFNDIDADFLREADDL